MRVKVFCSFLLWVGILACHTHKYDNRVKSAVVRLAPTKGSQVTGYAYFQQNEKGVKVDIRVEGLNPGQKHGYHIHEFGDLSKDDGTSCGGHYNPKGYSHGLPPMKERHAGSFGNLLADEKGVAKSQFTDDTISVNGHFHPILGRCLVIHAKEDDGGQPTGNAGSRVAIGVIGVRK